MQYFSPLNNTLRLSFDSLDAYSTFIKANVTMSNNIWLWHEILGDRDERNIHHTQGHFLPESRRLEVASIYFF